MTMRSQSTSIAAGAVRVSRGLHRGHAAANFNYHRTSPPARSLSHLGNAKCMNVVLFGAMCDRRSACADIDWEAGRRRDRPRKGQGAEPQGFPRRPRGCQGQVRRFTDYKKTRCQQAACLFFGLVWDGILIGLFCLPHVFFFAFSAALCYNIPKRSLQQGESA